MYGKGFYKQKQTGKIIFATDYRVITGFNEGLWKLIKLTQKKNGQRMEKQASTLKRVGKESW